MKKIVIAIDSFKGCLSSQEANQAAAEGVVRQIPDAEIVQVPVSDGGEGWLEAFRAAIGGELIAPVVRDPLMRPVTARYLKNGETAVIEMAQASGLTLLSPEERNPLLATTYGTGQLVVDAVSRGCKTIIVGLGGSATSDCGIGMLRAIIDGFAKHGKWADVHQLDDVQFIIATDVTNPLCGENGAAHVFAPQKFAIKQEEPKLVSVPECEQTRPKVKGAKPDVVRQLDERARRFAEVSARHFGFDRQNEPGAGAAGGLGYAFLQYMNATSRSGIDLLLDTIRFDDILKDASLVVTGEGSADRQTLMGKLAMGILRQSGKVPVCLIAGRISDREQLLRAGFAHVECINPRGISLEEAMRKEVARQNIRNTVSQILSKAE